MALNGHHFDALHPDLIAEVAWHEAERTAMQRDFADHGHEQGDRRQGRLQFVSDAELENQAPPEWLVEGILLTRSVAQMVGAPGSMKSFLALDLASHVRLGRPWAGRRVAGGPVVYVLAEGVRSMGLRLQAWKLHHQHDSPLDLHFLPQPLQLADPVEVGALLREIERLRTSPQLIVFDTQARCSVGIEENSNTEMGRLLAGVERIQRATDATVLLLHHPARDGDRERGAGAQRGAVDTTLLVSADGDHLTLKVDRQKDGEEGTEQVWRRQVVEVADGRTSCVLIPVTEQQSGAARAGLEELPASVRTLLEALRIASDATVSTKTLLARTGLKDRTFYDALKKAKGWKLIEEGRGWRLSPAGRDLFG